MKKKPGPKRWIEIMSRLAANGTLVEVGVWKGDSAFRVLDARPDVKLILVDPWNSGQVDAGLMKESDWLDSGARMARASQVEVDRIFDGVVAQAARYGDRCRILRMESVDAAKEVRDGSLDMVFIDGNHSFKSVSEDIGAWLAKVKTGGIIGGHDFDNPRFLGVKQAVIEAFGENPVKTGVDRTWFVTL